MTDHEVRALLAQKLGALLMQLEAELPDDVTHEDIANALIGSGLAMMISTVEVTDDELISSITLSVKALRQHFEHPQTH